MINSRSMRLPPATGRPCRLVESMRSTFDCSTGSLVDDGNQLHLFYTGQIPAAVPRSEMSRSSVTRSATAI
jgi:hypothetical protein